MDIHEFLLARIEQDERAARKLAETDRRPVLSLAMTVNHPERFLAECAAKRAILVQHLQLDPCDMDPRFTVTYKTGAASGANRSMPCPTIRALAAVYSDHPDYQPEWSI